MKDKLLIIAGSAPCVMDDIGEILSLLKSVETLQGKALPYYVMLIGCKSPAETQLGYVNYHVSHENDFAATKTIRKAAGLNTDYLTFSNNPWPDVHFVLPHLTPPTCSRQCRPRLNSLDAENLHYYSGSSAMLGLKVGIMRGHGKIILAGVPLNEGRYEYFQKGWTWLLPLLKALPIRAMSGFTKDIFGPPTKEWING